MALMFLAWPTWLGQERKFHFVAILLRNIANAPGMADFAGPRT